MHNPYYENNYTQYKSLILYHDENQTKLALEIKEKIEIERGHKLYTDISKFEKFYLGEMYHQKYYLRLVKDIYSDLRKNYNDSISFINDNIVAKINGYIKGNGTIEKLLKEIDEYNLNDKSEKRLIDIVTSYSR